MDRIEKKFRAMAGLFHKSDKPRYRASEKKEQLFRSM